MTPQKLVSEVSAGRFKSAYYFFGTEDYRKVEAQKYVAGQFLPDKQLATNYLKIDGRTTKCADLLAELSVYPMLGERQVFAISDMQRFKPTEVDRVLALLSPPDPNRVVLFSSPSTKTPKKSSAFFKKISAAVEIVEFKRLTQAEAANMITRRLKSLGLSIEPEAHRLLLELVAGNSGALGVEIAKLADYESAGETIMVADIRAVTSGFQVYSVFGLADEIIAGQRSRVLAQLASLLADGNSPTGLLYFLGSHFVSLYLVKNGRSLEPYRRFLESRFRSQAAGFTTDQLERAIAQIATADANLRRSPAKPELLLEQLVIELMMPATPSHG